MAELDLAPQPDTDYGFATDYDILEYSIHSLAASAAICNIENFVHYFDTSDQTLQTCALYSYLKQFSFEQNPIQKLCLIRQHSLNNAYICKEWDEIKCFLRLMARSGIPISVSDDDKSPCGCCDGYSDTTITFKDFIITKTISEDRFADNFTSGWSYSINKTYHQLKLILSGDIETNPGPNTHSKICNEEKIQEQRKKLNQMQREIEKLRKAQIQQQHFVQRQLELEKRDRKKKREFGADRKRYAQTLVTETAAKLKKDVIAICTDPSALAETAKAAGYVAANVVLPGAGTAAAAVVNGSKLSSAVNKLNPTIDLLQGVLKTLSNAADELKKPLSCT